jgi:hypothetical protein
LDHADAPHQFPFNSQDIAVGYQSQTLCCRRRHRRRLTVSAIVNQQLAKKAQRDNPPTGRFIEVDGVRLHYVERGAGRPLVLFHGNGSMIQDFESSGLIYLAAQNYRVIVFDRPGYGHSDRPRNVVWTPAAQAELFFEALQQLGVHSALVLGHSWGAWSRCRLH